MDALQPRDPASDFALVSTSWVAKPVPGVTMERLNAAEFCEFGGWLAQLRAFASGMRQDAELARFMVQLTKLHLSAFNRRFLERRKICQAEIATLVEELDRLSEPGALPDIEPFSKTGRTLVAALDSLRDELGRRLPGLYVYALTDKRAYDIDALINQPETMLSDEARSLLTDHQRDNWREAGRCLAYEVPTAAAFHVLRVVEGIVRKYYQIAAAQKFPERSGTVSLVTYIKRLRTDGNVPRGITAALSQLRAVHRNPTMHPGPVLSQPQALSLVGLCVSVIDTIAEDIVARRPG